MSRADIIRRALLDYHARRITLGGLLRALTQWRPRPTIPPPPPQVTDR